VSVTLTAGGTTTFAAQALNKYGAGQFSGLGNSSDVYAGGEAYAWGYNFRGNIGDGTTVNKSSPVQVGTDTNYAAVSAGGSGTTIFNLAIRTDGTLWAWGSGTNGHTGLNSEINHSSPVQVGALTNWASVEAAHDFALATKTDGTLWAWGKNGSGELGDGTVVDKSSPIQVGSETNWSKVRAGSSHSGGFTTDNKLYVWGNNGLGQLGLGDIVSQSSPVQLAGEWSTAGFGQVYTLAIKTDGGLYAFGYNVDGGLGLGDNNIHRSSPVQVGSLTTWDIAAASKGSYVSAAIKTDGTLWTWGNNNQGELGQNNRVNKSSPVQVGSETGWKTVSTTDDLATGTKNGELYMWGIGTIGQLGQDNLISRSSPVQVGSGTDWIDSDVTGVNFAIAIQGVTS
jgi:alpha-tubulin suppressor-like RCC1 family protein